MTTHDPDSPTPERDSTSPAAHPSGSEGDPTAPFVVELPNGQRLEIGDVPPGTVVEVATWRGAGAPDARTERIVIAVTPPAEDSTGQSRRGDRRRSTRWALAGAVTVAVVVGFFAATPLAATVPRGGDDVLGGRASSAVVITRPAGSLQQGLAVLVRHPRRGVVVLGRVQSVSSDVVLVRAGSEFLQVAADDIVGDVIVVVPLLGAPFSWFTSDEAADRSSGEHEANSRLFPR